MKTLLTADAVSDFNAMSNFNWRVTMIKQLLAIMFFFFGFLSFAEGAYPMGDIFPGLGSEVWFKEKEFEWRFNYGSACLSYDPSRSLEYFQSAKSLVDKYLHSDPVYSFIISFGQVIAYDRLGLTDQCKQEFDNLFLILNHYDSEDDSDDEEVSFEDDSDDEEEVSLDDGEEDDGWYRRGAEAATQFFQNFSALASSVEIRERLFDLAANIAEKPWLVFSFAEGMSEDRDIEQIEIEKSLWKKFGKRIYGTQVAAWAYSIALQQWSAETYKSEEITRDSR